MLVSRLSVEFVAKGYQAVINAEERVKRAISDTARTAEKDSEKTKNWMERHKTALQGIGLAATSVMAAIIAASPSLRAALGEIYLWFSMLAMEIGESWAPKFEWLAEKAEALYNWFDKLPQPIKDLISNGLLLGLAILIAAGAFSALSWALGPAIAGVKWLAGLLVTYALAPIAMALGISTLALALAVLAGLVLGGIVVWGLWKLGVIQAVEDAGAAFGRWLHNTLTILGNFKDNVVQWLTLVAATATVWGAQFALNWVHAVIDNVPYLGEKLGGLIDPIQAQLAEASAAVEEGWNKWNSGGGFMEGLTVGVQTGPLTPNRTISDMIGGADSAIFGLIDALKNPDTTAAIEDTQTKILDLEKAYGPEMTRVADEFARSQEKMQKNISTTALVADTSTTDVRTTTTKTFSELTAKSPIWGSDLIGNFVLGMRMRMPELMAQLAQIRSAIEASLSFDLAANDRMAERWGRDMVSHFNRGAAAVPVAAPMGGGRGGDVNIHGLEVRVNFSGSDAKGMDERKLTRMISDAIADAMKGRR
jgi:hypothetical protein